MLISLFAREWKTQPTGSPSWGDKLEIRPRSFEVEDRSPSQRIFFKNFPRMKWDDLIDDVEWDRFAKSNGTAFPRCQYSMGSVVVPEKETASASTGVGIALVGDACHALYVLYILFDFHLPTRE